MFQIVFIVSVAVIIALYEIPALIKKKWIKEIWAFSFFLLFGVVISILTSLNIEIPNPMEMLTKVFKIFNDLLEKI